MYKRILVPIDGTAIASRGLEEAIKIARLAGASLRLLHVVELINLATSIDPVGVASDAIAMLTQDGREILERGKGRAAAEGIAAETVLLDNLSVRVSAHVVAQAKAWKAELIVIGTHGRRGLGRLVLGSDAEEIVRSAPVPVLMVRDQEAELERIEVRAAAFAE